MKRPVLLAGFAFTFIVFVVMVIVIPQEKELVSAQYAVSVLLLWMGMASRSDK